MKDESLNQFRMIRQIAGQRSITEPLRILPSKLTFFKVFDI